MKHINNIEISQKTDRDIQQGESCFKYVILAFVAACWLCKSEDGSAGLESVQVHKFSVAAVGDQPVTRGRFDKYSNGDPMCGGETWCFLGWRL